MNPIIIREPILADEIEFLAAMQRSQAFHSPWSHAPQTHEEFIVYLQRYQQINQKSFLVCLPTGEIVGVINLNEIIRGAFQNAFLGYYAVVDYANQGYMSSGLQLVIKKAFGELGLHRLEANIQPENIASIKLVQRNNFRKEGLSLRCLKINDQWCDHERWAITAEEFSEAK